MGVLVPGPCFRGLGRHGAVAALGCRRGGGAQPMRRAARQRLQPGRTAGARGMRPPPRHRSGQRRVMQQGLGAHTGKDSILRAKERRIAEQVRYVTRHYAGGSTYRYRYCILKMGTAGATRADITQQDGGFPTRACVSMRYPKRDKRRAQDEHFMRASRRRGPRTSCLMY